MIERYQVRLNRPDTSLSKHTNGAENSSSTGTQKWTVRWRGAVSAVLALLGSFSLVDEASAWPTKPITILVAATPGAATDVVARIVGQRLSAVLGQPVVVDNKPGASGIVAANAVVRAGNDGHTLLLAPMTLIIAPHVMAKGGASNLNVLKELTPITKVAASPLVITVHPDLKVKSIQEYIALSKKKQGGISFGSSGVGSPFHIAAEVFQRQTGAKLTHIAYKGLGQAATDAISGQVESLFATTGGVITEMINSGKAIPLAVAGQKRSALLPNVPTLTELGIPNVEFGIWFAMFAPSATPQDVIARLNVEINAILRTPEVKARLQFLGVDAVGSSLAEISNEVASEYSRYGRIVTDLNIRE